MVLYPGAISLPFFLERHREEIHHNQAAFSVQGVQYTEQFRKCGWMIIATRMVSRILATAIP